MEGDTADAAAMLEDGADVSGVVDGVDAAAADVAEKQAMVSAVDGGFDEPVAVCDPFHVISPSSWFGRPGSTSPGPTPVGLLGWAVGLPPPSLTGLIGELGARPLAQ